jgi:hypothetical protein
VPLPEQITRLLVAARRRLVAMSFARRLVTWLALAGAGAAILLAIARFWVISWAKPLALAMLVGVVLLVALITLLRRPSALAAALAVDRRLGGYDRVSTSVELADRVDLDPLEKRQMEAAAVWAQGRGLDDFGKMFPGGSLPKLAALTLAASLILALVPSPADQALAQQRAEQAVIEREADRLEGLAEESPPEVKESLQRLAEELRRAESLDRAIDVLAEARQELAEQSDPADLAQQTALAGLERRLAQNPLGEGESAAEQLRSLAQSLATADPEQLAQAAAELAQRAEDFAGIDQQLSEALAAAAQAIQQGLTDPGALPRAAEALRNAADQIDRAAGEVAETNARAGAQAEVRDAQQRLDDARGREGQQGQGQGEGQGEGQGQGQGQGEGQGQGQGQGSAGGGSGAGGQSGTGSTPGGTGSGAVPPGSGDDDEARDPTRSSVFDPGSFGLGDEVRVRLDGSGQPGDPSGPTSGQGIENLPLAPYTSRFAEYRNTALDSLDRLVIPSGLRDLVRIYFTELEP